MWIGISFWMNLNYSAGVASGAGTVSTGVSAGVEQDSSEQDPSAQDSSVHGAPTDGTTGSTAGVVSSDIIKRIGNRTVSIAGSHIFQEFMFDI